MLYFFLQYCILICSPDAYIYIHTYIFICSPDARVTFRVENISTYTVCQVFLTLVVDSIAFIERFRTLALVPVLSRSIPSRPVPSICPLADTHPARPVSDKPNSKLTIFLGVPLTLFLPSRPSHPIPSYSTSRDLRGRGRWGLLPTFRTMTPPRSL